MTSTLKTLVLAGAAIAATSGSALAQEYGYWGDRDSSNGYYRQEDLRHDYRQAHRLREDIERDQARLDQAYRWGRYGEAAAIRRDLGRDYRRLRALHRDIRRDEGYR
jgi:hypothetical protein